MKDHTESVLIEFDSTIISFEEILVAWSQMHRPYHQKSVQYRSAIFVLNEEQEEIAEDIVAGLKAAAAAAGKRQVYVDVQPATRFYKAEEYHQNYLKKANPYV